MGEYFFRRPETGLSDRTGASNEAKCPEGPMGHFGALP